MERNEIDALTGLRGIAALWVFLFHAGNFAQRIRSDAGAVMSVVGGAGYLGVDIFFVLSGFILAHNYLACGLHANARLYGGFLWKRLARIYPVHICALLLLLALKAGLALYGLTFMRAEQLSLDGLLATLTLTHAWSLPIVRTWNTVSWSISCEWAAYLLFPAASLLASHVQSRRFLYSLLPAIFILLGLFVTSRPYHGTMAYGMPRIAAEFTAGVFLYRLWMLRGYERGSGFDKIALAALVALIPCGNLLVLGWGQASALAVLPIISCGIVYGLAAGTGPVSRALGSRAANFTGRISYAFYMVHGLILAALAVTLRKSGLADGLVPGLAAIGLAAAATVLVAIAVHRWCEVPLRRLMVALLYRGAGHEGAARYRRDVACVPHVATPITDNPHRT